MIISLLFAILNGYFAFQAFRRKEWMWFGLSLAIAVFCVWQLLP